MSAVPSVEPLSTTITSSATPAQERIASPMQSAPSRAIMHSDNPANPATLKSHCPSNPNPPQDVKQAGFAPVKMKRRAIQGKPPNRQEQQSFLQRLMGHGKTWRKRTTIH